MKEKSYKLQAASLTACPGDDRMNIMTDRTEERRNRFTNEREFLTKEEAQLHDKVFVHEALEEYPQMQKCIDKFSRLNPKAYMTLLD